MEKKEKTKKEKYRADNDESKNGAKKSKRYIWPLTVTLITFVLSAVFSFGTELVTSKAGLAEAIAAVIILVAVSIIFDTIGVAVTACDIGPLTAMAARKVRGSKFGIKLVKNADKVSSICADVIGDICGIVSGAGGAAIAFMLFSTLSGKQLVIGIIISAVLASLTVGGKAAMKRIAINHSTKIVLTVGKFFSVFKSEDKK